MFKNVLGIFLIILWSTLNAVNSLQAQTVLPGIPFQMQARDRLIKRFVNKQFMFYQKYFSAAIRNYFMLKNKF